MSELSGGSCPFSHIPGDVGVEARELSSFLLYYFLTNTLLVCLDRNLNGERKRMFLSQAKIAMSAKDLRQETDLNLNPFYALLQLSPTTFLVISPHL